MSIIDQASWQELDDALRLTTRRLTSEIVSPREVGPDWNDLQWCAAIATAATNGISVLMAKNLRWSGPREWRTFLDDQLRESQLRDRRLHELLSRIDDVARREHIAFVALKGAALRAMGIYRCGERPMADIDLLVRQDQEDSALRLMEGLGLKRLPHHWRHISFGPARTQSVDGLGEHGANPIYVEIHNDVGERLGVDAVSITNALLSEQLSPGINPYPTRAALMEHLLLHAAGNASRRSLRLIQLEDIRRLASDWTARDWQWLLGRPGRSTVAWWANVPLSAARRDVALTLPDDLMSELDRHCPRAVRRFARSATIENLSNTSARLEPLRGIEWYPTLPAVVRFMISRVGMLRDPEVMQQHAGIDAAQPSGSPWQLAQRTWRIARWAGSRPMRPHALRALKLAERYISGRTVP